KVRPRPTRRGTFYGSVSLIVAAHNEEAVLPRRLEELTGLLTESGIDGEVIVISDGSTDNTAAVARGFGDGLGLVEAWKERRGKAAALNAGSKLATGEILVFADARQTWDGDALTRLLENFADETVGAVSGDLVVESSPGFKAGVGAYWRYEKWLRKKESQI